jgi:hypothetical protein
MGNESYRFDFNRVTYREVLELDLDDDENEKQASEDTMELISRVLVEWPHDGEITVDAILDLGLEDFANLQLAFTEAMDSVFKKSD